MSGFFRTGAVRLSARREWLVLPALALLVIIFAYPVGTLLLRSVTEPRLGFQNFAALFTQTLYARALLNTVIISASVTLICFLAGYPLAYSIARSTGRVRRLLIFAVLVPFWTSILVRTFAWLVLLQTRGCYQSRDHVARGDRRADHFGAQPHRRADWHGAHPAAVHGAAALLGDDQDRPIVMKQTTGSLGATTGPSFSCACMCR